MLIIVILTVSNLIMINTVSAQSVPKPSVPQFSLKIVDNTVQTTIENQPIIPNGHDTAYIFIDIRIKSHDSIDWVNVTVPNLSEGIRGYISETGTSGYTIIQKDINSICVLLRLPHGVHQIDYQVEAINGYLNTTMPYAPPIGFDPNSTPVIIVSTSGWSETQTITISSNEPTVIPNTSPTTQPSTTVASPTETVKPSQNSKPTPTEPVSQAGLLFGFNWQIIALIATVVGVVLVAFGLMFWQKKKQNVRQA
ncbi:MAG: hypothetical protein ACFCUE_08905 [Candidatus Bathyarchaeia archaeon]